MGELQLPFALQQSSSSYKHIPISHSRTMDSPLLSPAPPPQPPRQKFTILGIPIFTFKRNKHRGPPEEPDRQKKAAAKKTRWPFFSPAKRSKKVDGSASLRDSKEKNHGMKGGRESLMKVEYCNANEKLSGNSYAGAVLPSSPLRSTLEVILEDIASNTKEKRGDDDVEGIKLELFTPSPSHGGSPPPTLSGIFDDIAHIAKEKRGEKSKLYLFSPSPSHWSSSPPILDAKECRDEEVKWTIFTPSPNHGGSPPLPTLSSIPDDIACNAKERSGEENKLDPFGPFPCRDGSLPWTLGNIARNAFNPLPSHGGSPPSTFDKIASNAKEERGEKWDSFSPSPSHGGSSPPPTLTDILDDIVCNAKGNSGEETKLDIFSPSPSHGNSSPPLTLSDILDDITCNAKERGIEETKFDLFGPSPNHGCSMPPTISDIARNAEEKRDEDSEEKMKLDRFSPSESHGGSLQPQTLSVILEKNNNDCGEEINLNIFSPSQSRSGSPKLPPTTIRHAKEDEEDEINWNPLGPSDTSNVPSEMVAHRTGGLIRRDPPHLQMMLILRKIVIMQKVVRAISYSQGLFSGLLSDAKRSMGFLAVSELRAKGKRGPQLCNKRILMGRRCRPLDIEEGRFDGGSGPMAGAEYVPKSPRRDEIIGSG